MKNPRRDDGDAPLPGEQAPTQAFGVWLRQHREVRDIGLREIADASKIGLAYLQAFEEERFDLLPAPVFAKGFLRQYAAYVGIDPEEAVNFYLSACRENSEDEECEPSEARVPPSRASAPRFVLLALLLALFLVAAFWAIRHFGGSASSADPVETTVGIAVPSNPRPPADDSAGDGSAGSTMGDEPGPEPAPSTLATSPSSTISTTAPVPPVDSSAPLRMVVDFSGECWVETVVDGVQRHAEIKVQGESLVVEAQEAIDLKVGNVRVVQVEVNGLSYPLAPRGNTSVRSVRIDRSTLASLGGEDPPEGGE